VRLVDIVFRGGHLSERALTELCFNGDRPAHLDRCDICAERAVALGRWLDDVREVATDEADAAFPAERLAAQQTQILRRLEQVDRPKRVIAFPAGQPRERERVVRGVRPAWVGFAAAAGLVLGLLGNQITGRVLGRHDRVPARPAAQTQQAPATVVQTPVAAAYDVLTDLDLQDRPFIEELALIDANTPHMIGRQIVLPTSSSGR
jgi:hypothetical protein